MAQVSGQSRKKRLNILAFAIPSQKSGAGKAVSQVMEARTRTAFSAPQPTPMQSLAESKVNVGVIQPAACAGDKEGSFRSCRSEAHAFLKVALKHGRGRSRDGHPSGFSEFTVANEKQVLIEIHIA